MVCRALPAFVCVLGNFPPVPDYFRSLIYCVVACCPILTALGLPRSLSPRRLSLPLSLSILLSYLHLQRTTRFVTVCRYIQLLNLANKTFDCCYYRICAEQAVHARPQTSIHAINNSRQAHQAPSDPNHLTKWPSFEILTSGNASPQPSTSTRKPKAPAHSIWSVRTSTSPPPCQI